jgi:hypothetical protein
VSSLLWLDWRLLVNRVRSIRHNPRRLIPWALFLVWLIPSLLNRFVLFRARPVGRGPSLDVFAPLLAPLGDLIPGIALLLIGVAVWRASTRAPAAFQSPADARFVIGAGLDPRAVFAWLALRTVRSIAFSVVLVLVFFQIVYLPWFGIGGDRALLFTIAAASFGVIVFGVRLVAFDIQRRARWLPVGGIGAALAVVGLVLAGAAIAQVTGLAQLAPQFETVNRAVPPGSWLMGAFGGNATAELPLAVLAVGFTLGGILLADDCYPELWDTSARVFAIRRAVLARGGIFGRRERRPESGPAVGPVRSAHSSGRRVPGGAWTVLWKEWLTVQRGRGGLILQAALMIIAVVVGAVVGTAAVRGSAMGEVLAANLALLLVIWSFVASVQLGRDLGNPLWWLAGTPLWSRLGTWTLARGMRFAAPIIVLLEVAILTSGQSPALMLLAPWPPLALCWLMQTVALGSYALLPARTDYRLALTLRTFTVYAILLPLSISIVPGLLLRDVFIAVAVPMLVASSAIACLIAFAAWRIQGNGLAFAQEERS